ncbi:MULTISPECIES: lysoplasmalogenase family protein [Microbacterium]|nr:MULTISPECIES: lysoplasmalogenase family protein [Microbacterium]
MTTAPMQARPATRTAIGGFVPYALISVVHVGALAVDASAIAGPTKLLLMPALALAVLWAARPLRAGRTLVLLLAAIGMSWLGDGAATFFPFLPELPVMLACFGLAHLAYIWLFARELPARRLPRWTAVYLVWWVVLLAVLWPHLGALTVAVALYGIVLAGTAATAARTTRMITWGAVFFLTSDTLLAFRIFVPDALPEWTGALVMLTYTLGQGLIAAGVVRARRIS